MRKCWYAGCHVWIFGYSVYWMYTGFGIKLYAAVMLPKFSAAKILQNPKLKNKRKIFMGGFSKKYGFASQEFLVVRGNGWRFLWSGRHACRRKGVGVCQGSRVYLSVCLIWSIAYALRWRVTHLG